MIRGALFFAISPLSFRKPGCSIRLFSVERVVYPPLLPLLSSCPSIRKERCGQRGRGKANKSLLPPSPFTSAAAFFFFHCL